MSFLTAPVLDAFTRADGALGANWTLDVQTLEIEGNRVKAHEAGEAEAHWSAAILPADQEAYVTRAVLGNEDAVYVRRAAGTRTAYLVVTAASAVQLFKVTAGLFTGLTETKVTWSAGDVMGIQVIGTKLHAFRQVKGEGVPVQLLEHEDGEITGAGFAGIGTTGTVGRLDNFGAGAVGEPGLLGMVV